MALYQNSVLKKYLKQQDGETVAKAFKKFTKYFHDTKIQENIRSSKEEEYQGIFLTELFSKILGYTMKPNANFNLVAEYKNEKNSRKADGAILKDNEAIGVIELKGTNTKDLEKVRQQAFDYKANQTGCVYVITSNFEKIRFYINNAVDFEEFDLFNITEERFALMYLCLAQENLINNIPLKIKEASVQEEEAITKQFYKDYSTFKRELFRDLVKLNMKNEVFRTELNIEDTERVNKNIKHNLFKKSQKLIDRFLFIFFAEDRGLLPPNSTIQILDQWNRLKEDDAYFPLYHRYKLYFNYLDQGRAGKNGKAEIFAYNGGLFKPDAILDSLVISDELLYKHTNALQAYDFESQVDVNILGHIFENSLNEIESVNAEIEGTDFDKQKTKRKKDGVFYTPKYITKYIVDNTVGKLCNEKKAELGVIEEEYFKSRKGRTKAKLKELMDNTEAYREWLLQLTILDPACGSGAFLNQALDYLIKEHGYIDGLQTNLLGGGLVFPNIENTVLENNIFGVDLNEESIEIAKLSLWLRTAQPRRKLNNLSDNIKCGNSLIDSKAVAGDKAFKWEEEFAPIFEKGGFDVIIGNPPYVRRTELPDEIKKYIEKEYYSAFKQYDLYILFNELALRIVKKESYIGLIQPNKFLSAEYGFKICNLLINNAEIISIYNVSLDKIFEEASVYPYIFIYKKTGLKLNHEEQKVNLLEKCNPKGLLGFDSILKSKVIIDKIVKGSVDLGSIVSKVKRGVPNSKITYQTEGKFLGIKSTLLNSPYYQPKPEERFDYKTELDEKIKVLEFTSNLIMMPRTILKLRALLKDNTSHILDRIYYFDLLDKEYFLEYLLAILNSKLSTFYYDYEYGSTKIGGGYIDLKGSQIVNFKIPKTSIEIQNQFKSYSDNLIQLNGDFQNQISIFQKYLQSKITLEKSPNKLQKWHELEFGDFIKELNKAIKKVGGEKLTKMDEMEWMDVFETKKSEAQTLKAEIDKTDAEIDAMVYELYGLSEEEIKIVEGS